MNAQGQKPNMDVWLGTPPDEVPVNSTSQAYEKFRRAAAGAARLYGFQGYNSGAAQFVLVFDTNALPANGAVPQIVLPVAATSLFQGYFGSVGRWFSEGITLANSTTGPTLTLGAADCWFDVQFV